MESSSSWATSQGNRLANHVRIVVLLCLCMKYRHRQRALAAAGKMTPQLLRHSYCSVRVSCWAEPNYRHSRATWIYCGSSREREKRHKGKLGPDAGNCRTKRQHPLGTKCTKHASQHLVGQATRGCAMANSPKQNWC